MRIMIIGTLHEDYDNLSFLLIMRNSSDKHCRGNQNTFCDQYISLPANLAIYEIMWKHTVQTERPQVTI